MFGLQGDAGHYITALPDATQRKPEWKLATGLLLSAAENGGIVMMVRIAVAQALTGRQGVPWPSIRKAGDSKSVFSSA